VVPFYDLLLSWKGDIVAGCIRSSFEYLWLNTFVNCHFSLQHSQTPADNRNHLALAWPRIVDKLGINRHLQRSDELLKLQCQISISTGVFITMSGGSCRSRLAYKWHLDGPFADNPSVMSYLTSWISDVYPKSLLSNSPQTSHSTKCWLVGEFYLGLIAFLHAHNLGFILNSQLWFQIMAVT
jgi:hypothetical protein